MAYYISFLKTLSFRLNKHTIHFFYNEHTNDFPLYTEAIKFFHHSESMVRIAVRTLTLNVYKVDDDSMLRFVIDKTAVPYFANLVWFIGNHILEIDACVRNDADHRSLGRLKDLVAEHLDHVHYLNDILCLRIENLNEVLTGHLLNRLFIPLYVYSLVRIPTPKASNSATTLEDMKPHVSKVTALFLLSQVFLIITHVPLVRLLAWIIFHGDANIFTERGATRIQEYSSTTTSSTASSTASKKRTTIAHYNADAYDLTTLQASDATLMRAKPSFVAPSQPLEKSLKEHIQKSTSREVSPALATSSGEMDPTSVTSASKDKKKKKEKRRSKEPSPPNAASACEATTSAVVAAAVASEATEPSPVAGNGGAFASLPKLTGLSAGQAPTDSAVEGEESNEAKSGVGPITPKEEFSLETRPFLTVVFEVLDCSENDYLVLFSLCLLRAIQENEGMSQALLESVRIPCRQSNTKEWYNVSVVEKLLQILFSACQYGSKIRLVTLDAAIDLLKGMVVGCKDGKSYLADTHFAQLEGIKEESTLLLRNFYKSEEIFLDMFEDEYRAATRPAPKVELVLSDASLLLPPTVTPLTGIDFTKRLPCGEVERARRSIRTFFKLRQLSLDIQGHLETKLPLSSPDSCVQVQDVLDLNNSDLLAVTVTPNTSTSKQQPTSTSAGGGGGLTKQRRFLVVDVYQIVLVEPDATRLGWGVATFVGFLQDLEVVTDKEDSRCLHVTVHSPRSSSGVASLHVPASRTVPLLSATFTFDDHIRCMAAKQRLTKGRIKARQRKMHQIAKLLELPGNVGPACPSPPTTNLTSVRSGSNSISGGIQQDFSRSRSSSQSPRQGRRTGGSYRPLFNTSSKVPGGAALLGRDRSVFGGWPQQATGSTSKQTSSREQHQRRPASTSAAASTSSSGYPGESIAMSRFDRRESTGDDDVTDNPDEHEDTFDAETSLHND